MSSAGLGQLVGGRGLDIHMVISSTLTRRAVNVSPVSETLPFKLFTRLGSLRCSRSLAQARVKVERGEAGLTPNLQC